MVGFLLIYGGKAAVGVSNNLDSGRWLWTQ